MQTTTLPFNLTFDKKYIGTAIIKFKLFQIQKLLLRKENYIELHNILTAIHDQG